MEKQKQKPVNEIRISTIKAAIWRHDGENGPRYSVTFSRLYKKDGETQWKSSDSFGRDDLLLLAKVADQVHTALCQAQADDRADR